MIAFDPTKIAFEFVQMKSITTAMGGSITVVDETSKGGFRRVPMPMALARDLIMRHKKTSKYLNPVYTCLVRYGEQIVAAERHPLGSMGALIFNENGVSKKWEPSAKHNWDLINSSYIMNPERPWFFDGQIVYQFKHTVEHALVHGTPVSADGKFRSIECIGVNLQDLHNGPKCQPVDRSCLAFFANPKAWAISPPIWKDVGDVGNRAMSCDADGDDSMPADLLQFDRIDDLLAVNLAFVLSAGSTIGRLFGYETIEPLQLPRLMVELNTVNLPSVDKSVKQTYDVGMKFSHAVAWLLGLLRRADNLETYMVVRAQLKYLTNKGIFRKQAFDSAKIFMDNHNLKTVPLVNPDDVLAQKEDKKVVNAGSIIDRIRNSRLVTGISSIGSLLIKHD